MLVKDPIVVLIPRDPGFPGQDASHECPPDPPSGTPGGPPDSGGGICSPDAESCCVILMLPNEYGVVVPTLVCT